MVLGTLSLIENIFEFSVMVQSFMIPGSDVLSMETTCQFELRMTSSMFLI
jgi:hypothetical protein